MIDAIVMPLGTSLEDAAQKAKAAEFYLYLTRAGIFVAAPKRLVKNWIGIAACVKAPTKDEIFPGTMSELSNLCSMDTK